MSFMRVDKPHPTTRQSSIRMANQTPVKQLSARISKPPSMEVHPDNTILQFVKQMDGKVASILNNSLKQGEKLHQPQVKHRIPQRIELNIKQQPMTPMERVLLNKVEAGYTYMSKLIRIQRLSGQEKDRVGNLLGMIEKGYSDEQVHEELMGILMRKKLQLRILSNYGNTQYVGLTGIELLDNSGNLINCQISADVDTNKCIHNLTNGHHFTIDETLMWQTKYRTLPIVIYITFEGEPKTLRVWNYNRNRVELDKCVKRVEVLQNDLILWNGELTQGTASTYKDYSCSIELVAELKEVKKESQAPFYQSMQSMNSKKSDEREINLSKNSSQSKYSKPKLIVNPFEDESRIKKLEQNFFNEPGSNKVKLMPQLRMVKNSTPLVKQHTEEDTSSPPFYVKRGVARIAAGFQTGRSKRITIPNCPTGSKLIVRILKNWGDAHYVGLTGLEIFNCDGEVVEVNKIQGFFKDSQKLVDRVYLTSDDNNMCCERVSKNMEIRLEFMESKIAMIRIWNYNKARTHSSKCTRNVEILLDGDMVFSGEIKQGTGTCGPENAEFVMFTTNEHIVKTLEERDWLNTLHESQLQEERHILENTVKVSRPNTATFNKQVTQKTAPKFITHQKRSSAELKVTPSIANNKIMMNNGNNIINYPNQSVQDRQKNVLVKQIKIVIISNWGDRQFVGLDKIEFYDSSNNLAKIHQFELNSCIGSGLQRCDERWYIPNGAVQLRFSFQEPTYISRMMIQNYSKQGELDRGVQLILIYGDGQLLCNSRGVYIRRGIGIAKEEVGQSIELPSNKQYHSILSNYQYEEWIHHHQDYETLPLPQGMKLTLKLISTWGDSYYIGLNGVEIFDSNGELLTPQIVAKPHSIRELPQMQTDVRTPDKLMSGCNVTMDPRHMWLAPYANSYSEQLQININQSICDVTQQLNQLVFLFDEPTHISALSIYNYSKTPLRGVREIEISFDEYIIYRGYLNLSTVVETQEGINGNNKTTILFTKDERIIELVHTVAIRESILGTETVLINEKQKLTYNTIQNQQVQRQIRQQRSYKNLLRPTTTQVH